MCPEFKLTFNPMKVRPSPELEASLRLDEEAMKRASQSNRHTKGNVVETGRSKPQIFYIRRLKTPYEGYEGYEMLIAREGSPKVLLYSRNKETTETRELPDIMERIETTRTSPRSPETPFTGLEAFTGTYNPRDTGRELVIDLLSQFMRAQKDGRTRVYKFQQD